ncbi:acetyltransferase [Allorhodopirellula solitaria]|uniref:Putative acetyltransferase EpsM n=1 Tax=Allorhodopirellula solitaria TaxID=2527987 RepID=A0A5C5XQ72_9BACT|nr:acetyltransferase [Allorhodopirellula solitaria]TWT65044.1 putative acetyltransferase EpsM [Allorhodopirellula solitaria]
MNQPRQFYVVGAGGHAKVTSSVITSLGHQVAAALDDDLAKNGGELAGVRIVAPCDELRNMKPRPTIIGIGSNQLRQITAGRFDVEWGIAVHPSAILDPSVTIGRGSVVMAGAIIQAGTRIGEHCVINTGATVDHDCRVDDFCHVAPGVNLAGHCELEQGVFVGIGACAIPSVRIGAWATVGAGAAVVHDLPSGVVATGIPARPR